MTGTRIINSPERRATASASACNRSGLNRHVSSVFVAAVSRIGCPVLCSLSSDLTRPVCSETCNRKIPAPWMRPARAPFGYWIRGVYAPTRAASAGVSVMCRGAGDGRGVFAKAAIQPIKMRPRQSAARIDLTKIRRKFVSSISTLSRGIARRRKPSLLLLGEGPTGTKSKLGDGMRQLMHDLQATRPTGAAPLRAHVRRPRPLCGLKGIFAHNPRPHTCSTASSCKREPLTSFNQSNVGCRPRMAVRTASIVHRSRRSIASLARTPPSG
jgi:hypothetical protein